MGSGFKKTMQFSALAVLILLCIGCVGSRTVTPLAEKGVIELSAYDILLIDTVSLDGEWEFYWNQLLTPDDFYRSEPPAISGYMSFPGAWNRYKLQGKAIGRSGYATFRLRVLPPIDLHGELALRLGYLASSYRLWADGHQLVEGGMVGTNRFTETPNQHIHFAKISVSGQPIELVLQISNFHWAQGGPIASITLGSEERLAAMQMLKWSLAFLCGGVMLVMGVYHLFLFCFRPQNIAPLYFGIVCLLWMVLQLTSNLSDWSANLLVGDMPGWFQNRFDLVSFMIAVPMVYAYLRTLYPIEFSYRFQQAYWTISVIFVFLGLVLSTMAFSSAAAAFFIFTIFAILYCVLRLLAAWRRKRPGVLYILVGFIIVGFTGMNDILYDLQVINTFWMTHIGMCLFILFQSIALAQLFSGSFSAVEQLSNELAVKNISLEQGMAERTRLEREVVDVTEEERRRISQDLHDGLCQLLTSARLHLSALRRKLLGTGAQTSELNQLSSLLEASTNQAYDLSRGLWPVEHATNGNIPSLVELIRHMSELSGITIEFQQQRGCPECSYTGMTQLFRIAQEAVTNAIKHARPDRIMVGLDCADRKAIRLTIRDNGIGRNNTAGPKGGLGQRIMAHRASIINGTLTMADGDKGGTVVTCTAPCELQSMEDSQP
ncbi:7TM diverse intracellular signaling domain-containing protein [Thermodesulfobacteriota bacterium]